MTVSERASSTTQPVNLSVRYRDGDGNRHLSDPLEPSVTVAPERTWLAVTPESNAFTVDSDNRLTVRVRNVERVPLRNVVAHLAVDAPFETESRVAYVAELRPNESATLAFGLTVSEDAVPTRSSVRLNVTADRPDGETIRPDTADVPVVVADETGPTDPVLLAAGSLVALALLVAGWLWLRR